MIVITNPFCTLLYCLALVCVAGCSYKVEDMPAVTNTVVVNVIGTDEKVDGFLLVTVYREGPEVAVSPIADGWDTDHAVRASVVRANSGYTLEQPALIRKVRVTSEGAKTRPCGVEYYVLKDGYDGGGFNGNMVLDFKDMGNPVRVALEPDRPGQWDSDVGSVSSAECFMRDTIPLIPANDPLRAELIAILRRKVERVISAGQYKGAEVQAVLEALRQLELSATQN